VPQAKGGSRGSPPGNNYKIYTLPPNLPIRKPPSFAESRKKEINGLYEKGAFEFVDASEVPEGTRIFGSRFVDEIKHPGTDKAYEKSRLVIQAYNDPGKDLVLTQSPTVQRVSQRLILALAVTLRDKNNKTLTLYLQDILQAYVQSRTPLARDFYAKPSPELGLPPNTILKLVRPLYGVPEAGNHWFQTYHSITILGTSERWGGQRFAIFAGFAGKSLAIQLHDITSCYPIDQF
jgi:hypothetical protein